MNITYFGHSCFKLNENGFEIVIDPFRDVPGYQRLRTTADMVLCSHEHFDHNAVEGVKFRPSGKENPFSIRMMQTYHDNCHGKERGNNIAHIIEGGGIKIVHLGDLGHTLNDKQLEYVKKCDVLMLPIGGTYTIDGDTAWEVIDAVDPRVAIPMHYKNGKYGFDNIGRLSDFLTKSNRRIAVSTTEFFQVPREDKLLLVPAVYER